MRKITRRQFMIGAGALAAGSVGVAAWLSGCRWRERASQDTGELPPLEPPNPWSVEARHYASLTDEGAGDLVMCALCPHGCILANGHRGRCRTRENRSGRLYSMTYGNPCAVHVDPIEKKPFFHFLPTAATFSIATAGCNLRCLYCQNWQISQFPPEETQNVDLPPEAVVQSAQQSGAPVIAYTYSEPTAFYEYMLDTARLGREAGLYNVVISAGFINPDPLRELCAAVDAIKIDLKGYDEGFYEEVCGARLQPVLDAIRIIYEAGVHLEIVNLVVPTLNDRLDQLRALSRWVAQEISPDIPLHFSRFHPQYKLTNLPPTPVETLEQAREIALEEGVRFVYIGNVPGHPGGNTYCPACRRLIIARAGFAVREYHLTGGQCTYCGASIPGVWQPEETGGQPVMVPPAPPRE